MAGRRLITTVHWLQQSEANVPLEDEWLSPREKARIAAMHVPKRRAEWRLGRWTAKLAIASYWDLAHAPRVLSSIEVRPAPSGAPEVFWRGEPAEISISLSHRSGSAICTLARAELALGCDVEAIEPRSEAFISDYFTAEEQALVSQTPDRQRWTLLALLWSAKESALKALQTGLRLDTRSVRVDPEHATSPVQGPASARGDGGAETSQCGPSNWQALRVHCVNKDFQGWWRTAGKLVQTIVAEPAPSLPMALAIVKAQSNSNHANTITEIKNQQSSIS
jgi:4'-phosphopantetheinyl transferase